MEDFYTQLEAIKTGMLTQLDEIKKTDKPKLDKAKQAVTTARSEFDKVKTVIEKSPVKVSLSDIEGATALQEKLNKAEAEYKTLVLNYNFKVSQVTGVRTKLSSMVTAAIQFVEAEKIRLDNELVKFHNQARDVIGQAAYLNQSNSF